METEVAESYRSSLKDLSQNSKPLINMLTMLADDHEQHAAIIIDVIEDHIQKVKSNLKLPVLYLVDSIIKNLQTSTYRTLFPPKLVKMFCETFEQVDEKTRQAMFKLRQTWVNVIPNKKLYALDVKVNALDPAWPITATPPEQGSIHVNPKFLVQEKKLAQAPKRSEEIMRQQLIEKQQELQKLKLELELAETTAKLEQQRKQLELKKQGHNMNQPTPPVDVKPKDPRVAARDPRRSRDPRKSSASADSGDVVTAILSASKNEPTNIPIQTAPPIVTPFTQENTHSNYQYSDANYKSQQNVYPHNSGRLNGPISVIQANSQASFKKDNHLIKKTQNASKPKTSTNKNTSPPKNEVPQKSFTIPKHGKSDSPNKKKGDLKNQAKVDPAKDKSKADKSKPDGKLSKSENRITKDRDINKDIQQSKSNKEQMGNVGYDGWRGSSKETDREVSKDLDRDRHRSSSKETDHGSNRDKHRGGSREQDRHRGSSRESDRSRHSDRRSSGSDDRSRHSPRSSRHEDEKDRSSRRNNKRDSTESKSSSRRSRSPVSRLSPRGDQDRNQNNQKMDTDKTHAYSLKKMEIEERKRMSPKIEAGSEPDGFPDVKKRKLSTTDNVTDSKKSDLSDLFGSEDIDYRTAPSTIPFKSPGQKRWAQFKENHPEDYKHEADRRRASEVEPGQDVDLRRLSSRQTSIKPQVSVDISTPIPDALTLENQEAVLRVAEEQLRSGTITHQQHQDVLRQLTVLYDAQRSHKDQKKKIFEDDSSKSQDPPRNVFDVLMSVPRKQAPTSPAPPQLNAMKEENMDDDLPKKLMGNSSESGMNVDDDDDVIIIEDSIPSKLEQSPPKPVKKPLLPIPPVMPNHENERPPTSAACDFPEFDPRINEGSWMSPPQGYPDKAKTRAVEPESLTSPPHAFDQDLRSSHIPSMKPPPLPPILPSDRETREQENFDRPPRDSHFPEERKREPLLQRPDIHPHINPMLERKQDRLDDRMDRARSPLEQMDRVLDYQGRRDPPRFPRNGPEYLAHGGNFRPDDGIPRRSPQRMHDFPHDGDMHPHPIRPKPLPNQDYPEHRNIDGSNDDFRRGDMDPRFVDHERRGMNREDDRSMERWGPERRGLLDRDIEHRGPDHRVQDHCFPRNGPDWDRQRGFEMDDRHDNFDMDRRPNDRPEMDRRDRRGLERHDINDDRGMRRPDMRTKSFPPLDPRWATCGVYHKREHEEIIVNNRPFELFKGAKPKVITTSKNSHEYYADPKAKGITVDGNLVYNFGEPPKDVKLPSGEVINVFYLGRRKELWLDGTRHEIRVDAPPKKITLNNKDYGIQIDGNDMMILIDRMEKGTFGGPPREVFVDGIGHDLRFEPQPRQILVDGQPCDLKLDRKVPVLIIAGEPRMVRFDGPPRIVKIDDQRFEVRVDFPAKVKIGTRSCFIALGGPGHELIINGKWHEIKFDGIPKEITVNDCIHTCCLDGPVPQLKILGVMPDGFEDVLLSQSRLSLTYTYPLPPENDGNKPRFPGPQGPRMLNQGPHGMQQGPSGMMPGPQGMMPGPQGMMPGPQGMAPQSMGGGMFPGGQMMMPGQQQQPVGLGTGMMMNPGSNMGMGMNPMPMGMNAMNPQVNQFPGMQNNQSMAQPPTSGIANVLSMLMPSQNTTQATTTTSTAGSTVDINSLFNKLVEAGIVKASKTQTTTEAATTSAAYTSVTTKTIITPSIANITTASKQQNPKKDTEEAQEVIEEVPDLTTFETADLKKPYKGVIQRLYSGIQCSTCGIRFVVDDTERYREHLDWHFRQNKRGKDEFNMAKNRQWHYEIDDWILFELIEESEEKARSSVFENMMNPSDNGLSFKIPEKEDYVHEPPAKPDADNVCCICGDPFEQFWHEELEDWHLREAILVDGKYYHPVCYEDARDESILEPTPTPTESPDGNPFFNRRLSGNSLTYGSAKSSPATPLPTVSPVTHLIIKSEPMVVPDPPTVTENVTNDDSRTEKAQPTDIADSSQPSEVTDSITATPTTNDNDSKPSETTPEPNIKIEDKPVTPETEAPADVKDEEVKQEPSEMEGVKEETDTNA